MEWFIKNTDIDKVIEMGERSLENLFKNFMYDVFG